MRIFKRTRFITHVVRLPKPLIPRPFRLRLFVSAAAIVAIAVPGCDSFAFLSATYSVFEVSDLPTGVPIEGASVIVRYYAAGNNTSRLRPTDENGLTHLPLSRAGSRPYQPVLKVSVSLGDQADEVDIPNGNDEVAEGEHFRIRIVDASAPPPPPPVAVAVRGSIPPTIELDGYVEDVVVCSNDTRQIVWAIGSAGNGQYYLESVQIGSVPEGFSDFTYILTESGEEARPCPDAVSIGQSGGLTIYFGLPFEETYYSQDRYCLGSVGEVVDCEE